MKIYQSWKRNEPSTYSGESITLTIVYTSFDKDEIDELEKKMPKGILVMDDKGEYCEASERSELVGIYRY